MKPIDNLEETIKKNLNFAAGVKLHDRMLNDVMNAQNKAHSAVSRPNIRRHIMKGPLTKLAAATVIIAVVVLGLFEFSGNENKSGVAWAEVAQKVQASRGLIVRCTESFLSNEEDYSIKYFSPKHSRTDTYKGGQIVQTYYTDLTNPGTKTLTAVYHARKHYLTRTFKISGPEFLLEKQEDWMNPSYLVETILSCEYVKLGQKTIDGILCEGIETTDPAVMGPLPGPVDRLDVEMRLWVNADTKYPVLFESEISIEAEGKAISSECVLDQFQWDVELDPGIFEPNIPQDYKDMRSL